jgi:hypothetical protein
LHYVADRKLCFWLFIRAFHINRNRKIVSVLGEIRKRPQQNFPEKEKKFSSAAFSAMKQKKVRHKQFQSVERNKFVAKKEL